MITRRETRLVSKKQIKSPAKKLILKYGNENVTEKRMANEIGVTEGAIYRHFKSKAEIHFYTSGNRAIFWIRKALIKGGWLCGPKKIYAS